MIVFRVIRAPRSSQTGWVIERNEPDGLSIVVSGIYATKEAADRAAEKLNQEAARRSMT